jgi:4'-phosphopantetheinyl transferase
MDMWRGRSYKRHDTWNSTKYCGNFFFMLLYPETVSDANHHHWREDSLDQFEITAGRVRFFHTSIEQKRNPALIQQLKSLLNETEKQKINRLKSQKSRHARLISYAFLKQILARCTGNRAEAVRFTQNRYGKPALAPGVTDQPVCFNLSHTRDLVVCAVTPAHDIGVDIEHLERPVNLSIADRFFSKQEAAALDRADASLKQPLFFRFWTLKEAYAKATGRGIAIGLDQFSFVLDRPEIRVKFHFPGQDDSGYWQFFQFSPVPGYLAAVAVNKKADPPLTLSIHPWVWD